MVAVSKPLADLPVGAPRIAPLDEPMSPALAERMAKLIPDGMRPPRLFLVLARNAELFARLVDTGLIGPTGLMDRRSLPRVLRECLILRTCVATGNDYEFNLHVQTISERMGLTPAQIDDVRADDPNPSLWSASSVACMQLVDALVCLRVPDAVFAQARDHFDESTLIEITQLVGLYVGVAMQVALSRPEMDSYRPGPPMLARTGAALGRTD